MNVVNESEKNVLQEHVPEIEGEPRSGEGPVKENQQGDTTVYLWSSLCSTSPDLSLHMTHTHTLLILSRHSPTGAHIFSQSFLGSSDSSPGSTSLTGGFVVSCVQLLAAWWGLLRLCQASNSSTPRTTRIKPDTPKWMRFPTV